MKLKFIRSIKLSKYAKITLGIIALAIIIRLVLTFFSYPSGDSPQYLAGARYIARTGQIPLFHPAFGQAVFWYAPFFHFIAAAFFNIFSIFGYNVAMKSMEFVSPLFGSLTLIVSYFIFKELLNEKQTLYSVIFLSVIPIHMYYSSISHLDATLTFFVVLTAYLALKKKMLLASLAAGLGFFTKFNFLFTVPLFFYLILRDEKRKVQIKKFFQFASLTAIFSSPWYIRDLILLGNPFGIYFVSLFTKLGTQKFITPSPVLGSELGIINLLNPMNIGRWYLDIFGVPLGIPSNLSFVPLYALVPWLLITILFFIPAIMGFFVKKNKNVNGVIKWWLIPNLFFLLLFYIYFNGMVYFRFFLPILPVLAITWGLGIDSLMTKTKNIKILFKKLKPPLIIILFILGASLMFIGAEFIKATTAAEIHTRYEEDYEWARINLPLDAIVWPQSDTLSYETDRFSIPSKYSPYQDYNRSKIYYFTGFKNVYQDLNNMRNIFPEELDSEEFKIVYQNNNTGVKVYQSLE